MPGCEPTPGREVQRRCAAPSGFPLHQQVLRVVAAQDFPIGVSRGERLRLDFGPTRGGGDGKAARSGAAQVPAAAPLR